MCRLSFVSVFNRADVLERCISSSLRRQTQASEFIAVDNTDGKFDRASAALNWGAARASGDWIVFVHQDVFLISENWTLQVLCLLSDLQPSGWTGVVGRDWEGRWQGLLRDRDGIYGEPFSNAREVQVLDEVMLIHSRKAGKYFDEELRSWHVYGVDACCQAILEGHRNYVIPAPIWHDSLSTNRSGLDDANRFIAKRYRGRLSPIRACCGDIPFRFERKGSFRHYQIRDRLRAWSCAIQCGVRPRSFQRTRKPLDVADEWTSNCSKVVCSRGAAWYSSIEGIGLNDHTEAPKQVLHAFGSEQFAQATEEEPDMIVYFPEQCRGDFIPPATPRWLFLECLPRNPQFSKIVRPLQDHLRRQELCRDLDDRYWLVSEYSRSQ